MCLASTSACGDAFSNTVTCCVEYNFLLLVLRPSVCSFLLVLARNLEHSVLGLDARLVGCPDLSHIPSSVVFFQEGDSRWDSVVQILMPLSFEMPEGV